MDNFHKTVDNFFTAPTVFHPDPSGAGTIDLYLVPKGYREMENGERCVGHQQPEAYHYQCAYEIAETKWKSRKSQDDKHPGQGCKPEYK